MELESLKRGIEQVCGFSVSGVTAVSGGDTAGAYVVTTDLGPLFAKVITGPQAFDMLTAESDGLSAIERAGALAVPRRYGCGKAGRGAVLVLEYVQAEAGQDSSFEALGRGLALMHRTTAPAFGWDRPNYIGPLPQKNPWEQDWAVFFAQHRLQEQYDRALSGNLLTREQVPAYSLMVDRIAALAPEVKPALLHGDLWGGNFLISKSNTPYLIDPSVYFGHSEVDLAMSRLFGGFPARFYDAYFEVSPALPGFDLRMKLYQLYYLLVHLNLFGRSYLPSVMEAGREVFEPY
jgi:fructosamine-3-kinase